MPRSVQWVAAGLSLLALVIAAWRTSASAIPLRARLMWMVGCGLGGLPALVSLWLMVPPRDRRNP